MKVWLLWQDQGYGENRWMHEVYASEDAAVAARNQCNDVEGSGGLKYDVEEREVTVDPEPFIERCKTERAQLDQNYRDYHARQAGAPS